MSSINANTLSEVISNMDEPIKLAIDDTTVNVSDTADSNPVQISNVLALPIGIEKFDPVEESGKFCDILSSSDSFYTSMLASRMPVMKYIKIGMVADRHNIPVDRYFFQSVPQDLMFNYQRQIEIATAVIKRNIKFDEHGNPDAGIFLYVTGLTCVLGSIIAACNSLGVDLTCMHFKFATMDYQPQIISRMYGDNICPPQLNRLKYDKIYTYGCSIDELLKCDHGYEIIEIQVSDSEDGIQINKTITFFTDESNAWMMYICMTKHCQDNTNIYLNHMTIGEKYERGRNISKMVNVTT